MKTKLTIISAVSLVFLLTVGFFVLQNLPQTRRLFTRADTTIDMLDYMISKHAVGKSTEPKSTGVTEWVGANFWYDAKTWVGAYEYRTWDNNYIYLKQDTSIGPGNIPANVSNAKSYRFEPGVWAKRFMNVGESVEMPANQLTWYDGNCQSINSWTHPYTMTLENHIGNYNAGGDLGVQDVIVLRYQYGTSYEKFFYSHEWGWIRWEEYVNNAFTRSADFNNITTNLLEPNPVCGAPNPPPPPAPPNPNPSPLCVKDSDCSPICPSPSGNTPNLSCTLTYCKNGTCQPAAPPISQQTTCQGNKNAPAKCFDCKIDGANSSQINIFDFSCFTKVYGHKVP